MKTFKLTTGIINIILSIIVVFQSMCAGIANSITFNGEVSGTAGIIVAIMLLTGGIVSIATKNNLSVAPSILYGFAAFIGFICAASFVDLNIWATWSLICCILPMIKKWKAKKCQN